MPFLNQRTQELHEARQVLAGHPVSAHDWSEFVAAALCYRLARDKNIVNRAISLTPIRLEDEIDERQAEKEFDRMRTRVVLDVCGSGYGEILSGTTCDIVFDLFMSQL